MPVTNHSQGRSGQSGAIVVISSAGGIPALIEVLSALAVPNIYPIFIAQHLPPSAPSLLAEILDARCALDVCWASDGQCPEAGKVYVVRPGQSLRIGPAAMTLAPLRKSWDGWLISADELLESLAASYREHAVAVVLSGMMAVGVRGLRAIKIGGGLIIAQSAITSQCFEMPSAACDLAKGEVSLSPRKIANALSVLA